MRLLLYFRWVIYSEEEALLASKYLRFLALLEEREQALLAPAVQEVSLVSHQPPVRRLSEWILAQSPQCSACSRDRCCAQKRQVGGGCQ